MAEYCSCVDDCTSLCFLENCRRSLRYVGINHHINSNDLSIASLVLIDRTEDLFTPTSHSGDFPLAHRIITTINRSYGKVYKTTLNDNNDFE